MCCSIYLHSGALDGPLHVKAIGKARLLEIYMKQKRQRNDRKLFSFCLFCFLSGLGLLTGFVGQRVVLVVVVVTKLVVAS